MGEVSAAGRARAAAGGAVRLSTLLYYHSATNPLILNLLGPDKPTVRFVIRINKIRLADHETRANPLE